MLLLYTTFVHAQVPQAINFQAVVRNTEGNVLPEQQVAIKLSLLQGSTEGEVIYEEIHHTITAQNGVINLQIGNGTPTVGLFTNINWSQSPYFISLSLDTENGDSFKKIATSPMLSVPYALYAEKAKTVEKEEELPDYFISPNDGPSSRFLTGSGEISSGDIIYLFVSYLNQQDQEVSFEIEGLPENTLTKYITAGSLGQYIKLEFSHTGSGEKYSCTCIFKNKYGITKSFPFTFVEGQEITEEIITPSSPDVSDENIQNTISTIVKAYQDFKTINNAIDNVFMGKKEDDQYSVFKEKNYTSSSKQVAILWEKAYETITLCNSFITESTNTNETATTSSTKENAIKQAKAIRAYSYLLLTQWFGDIPLIDPSNICPPESTRDQILETIIPDLKEATNITSILEETGELTKEEIQILLLESQLLHKDWKIVSEIEVTDGLPALCKKIATWKLNNTEGITEASIMDEYMNNFYSIYNRGNMYLNILNYSATYFNIGEYQTLLPIPDKEIQQNGYLTQNPGY